MAVVTQLRSQTMPWTSDEATVLTQIRHAFLHCGVKAECEHGITDDGVQWTVFFDKDRGSFLAHVARERRGYVLLWRDHTAARSRELADLIDVVRTTCTQHLQRLFS